jgi:hypothetical protein
LLTQTIAAIRPMMQQNHLAMSLERLRSEQFPNSPWWETDWHIVHKMVMAEDQPLPPGHYDEASVPKHILLSTTSQRMLKRSLVCLSSS